MRFPIPGTPSNLFSSCFDNDNVDNGLMNNNEPSKRSNRGKCEKTTDTQRDNKTQISLWSIEYSNEIYSYSYLHCYILLILSLLLCAFTFSDTLHYHQCCLEGNMLLQNNTQRTLGSLQNLLFLNNHIHSILVFNKQGRSIWIYDLLRRIYTYFISIDDFGRV